MKKSSTLIFDCDGVLVDSEVIAHEVETRVLSSIGLHYDPHEFEAGQTCFRTYLSSLSA